VDGRFLDVQRWELARASWHVHTVLVVEPVECGAGARGRERLAHGATSGLARAGWP
jgi:hypothetical protein